MESFTPLSGFAGGLLIGLAASAFVVIAGRITGISGIVGGAIGAVRGDRSWRLAFVVGLVLGPLAVSWLTGALPPLRVTQSLPTLMLAGLLVGYGTRLGNGCTSGHGVCGIARGSPRSMAATLAFFATALVTVFVHRHVLGA